MILNLLFCVAPRPELGEDAVVPSPSHHQQQQHSFNNRTPVYARSSRGIIGFVATPSPHPHSSSSGYMSGSSGGYHAIGTHTGDGGATPRSVPVEIMSVYHSGGGATSANKGPGGSDHDYGCVFVSSGLTPITPSPSTSQPGGRPLFITPGSEGAGSYANRARSGGLLGSGGTKSLQPVKVSGSFLQENFVRQAVVRIRNPALLTLGSGFS